MEIQFLMFLNFFDVISIFFRCFFSMFSRSIFCLFRVFAFLCFVVLCFVIDPQILQSPCSNVFFLYLPVSISNEWFETLNLEKLKIIYLSNCMSI